ncbi:MAG: alpha-L-arabinofuranosidase C-terminal domain-containing protein [Candidatus Acidiferrales bacterium]
MNGTGDGRGKKTFTVFWACATLVMGAGILTESHTARAQQSSEATTSATAGAQSFAPAKRETPTIEIQVDKSVAKVSPTLYGLMTEEINHAFDGGLYAEMVRNRTMRATWDGVNQWTIVTDGNALAEMSPDKSTGPSEALPNSLKLKVDRADRTNIAGVRNDGYWGMAVKAGTTYRGSFYAKVADAAIGNVSVALVNDETGHVAGSASVQGITTDWKRREYAIKVADATPGASYHLQLGVSHPGTLWLNLVSLFPPTYHDRANGNRIDLMEKLAAMHPQFLRFPGGNYLEGDHLDQRFQWKKTIGPLVDRPTHEQPWGYQSSDGMGLLEFLGWCEDLHIQPVLAVYAGYSMKQETTKPGTDLEPYVQDALEEIEYVTGDTSTKWGAVRANNGHPAPFALKYVEIGNEDWFDKSGNYEDRYAQFYKTIKAKYPDLQLIATAPLRNMKPDVQDDHYYRSAAAMMADAGHYDKIDRSGPKIFVGEWATIEGVPTPNMNAAIADAAWMTGLERNSDLVVMAAYAPLFVNVNPQASQWGTNLIGYNAFTSYGSPSYWAQVMFGSAIGTDVVASSMTGDADARDKDAQRLFYSVTRDAAKGELYLKIVNASSLERTVAIHLAGAGSVKPSGSLTRLSAAAPTATNSIIAPDRLQPKTSAVTGLGEKFEQRVPAYSISVYTLDVK